MMLPENEDSFESVLKRILHDVVHDLVAGLVKPLSLAIDHVPELSYFVESKRKYALNFFLECFKFLVIQVHDLIIGQNLEELLIEILSQGIHQQDGSLIWVAVTTSLLDIPELVEDQLDGFSDLV